MFDVLTYQKMLKDFFENMKKGGINPRIEGADKLQTLTEDSNPIIIYYEFKK